MTMRPDPTFHASPKLAMDEPEGVFKKTGYSRPHTVHCGPEGIYVSTLGGGGKDGTSGHPACSSWTARLFDILRWEIRSRTPEPAL